MLASFFSRCWMSEIISCTKVRHCCLSFANREHLAVVLLDQSWPVFDIICPSSPKGSLEWRRSCTDQPSQVSWLLIFDAYGRHTYGIMHAMLFCLKYMSYCVAYVILRVEVYAPTSEEKKVNIKIIYLMFLIIIPLLDTWPLNGLTAFRGGHAAGFGRVVKYKMTSTCNPGLFLVEN